MTTTGGAALNHPFVAIVVGFVWLVAAVVFVLFMGCVYTAYGVGYGVQRGWAWYTAKYRTGGRHRAV